MTLETLKSDWQDTEQYHKEIHQSFVALVNADPELKAHRDYVEQNIWGFGERSFWWLWYIVFKEFEGKSPSVLEIGVFRGATLSLCKMLNPNARVFGITPLNTSGGVWESDYEADIAKIHEEFELAPPFIYKGRSDDAEIIETVSNFLYDCIYIDGGHSREDIDNDLLYYAPLVKRGGFLVIDDACCDMHMPFGYFQGIQPVTDGLLAYMEENGDKWEFIFNVVHLRIYKRK